MLLLLMASLLLTNPVREEADFSRHFTVSGTLQQKSVSMGGAYYDYSQDPAYPLMNHTLYVVQWTDEKTVPVVIKSFTSDLKGNFTVSLPQGKYGFVEAADTAHLEPGQWLPKYIQTGDEMQMYECYWELSGGKPVELIHADITGIVLTRHESTICGICP